jgi:hydrogenase nickel incorporation protein HypB
LVALEARVLAKNVALAVKNRAWLAGRDILALNLVSSPDVARRRCSSARSAISETSFRFVVEGDQATANDGERIRAAGAPVVQVNTGTGCHLEADVVAHGLKVLTVSARTGEGLGDWCGWLREQRASAREAALV